LTQAALDVMNHYKADFNWIGIGLDLECGAVKDSTHLYSNNGVRLELTFEK
jgi:hypothetical protein